jgi:hypothetical protein
MEAKFSACGKRESPGQGKVRWPFRRRLLIYKLAWRVIADPMGRSRDSRSGLAARLCRSRGLLEKAS